MATALVYFFLISAIILFGKKELSQLSIVDLVFILLISNAVQNAMVNGDWHSFVMGVLASLTLFILNYAMKIVQYRSPAFRKLLGGMPTVLIENGKKLVKNLAKEEITDEEIMAAIREHGVEKAEDVKLAVLETDGNISIISFDHEKKTTIKRRGKKYPVRMRRQES
jgi:uncharacterized membrane protein YcaP (DUF421 family)